jgi:excisionase family DNA binding protein
LHTTRFFIIIFGMDKQTDKLLSTAEVAAQLGVTRQRVLELIGEERLPALKVGRAYVVRADDLSSLSIGKAGRPPGKVSTANKAATQPASGSNAALTAVAKAKKKGKR